MAKKNDLVDEVINESNKICLVPIRGLSRENVEDAAESLCVAKKLNGLDKLYGFVAIPKNDKNGGSMKSRDYDNVDLMVDDIYKKGFSPENYNLLLYVRDISSQ